MSILSKIIENKKQEVAARKIAQPIAALEMKPYFSRETHSLAKKIRQTESPGIISEFKRKSPSKGIINDWSSVEEVAHDYVKAGVSGLSILTDQDYFGGSITDLQTVRDHQNCPVLRKDFMVDEYQITEAKAIGADLILLIAACLSPTEIQAFGKLAQSLGMQVLLEVHNQAELERSICPFVDLVGVNNRDLTTFTVDLNHSYNLVNQIPNDFLKISESGISNPKTIVELREAGFDGFLIGETFMKTTDPAAALDQLAKELKA